LIDIHAVAADSAPTYTMTALDPASGKKYVDFTAINEAGETVGTSRPDTAGGCPTAWKPEGGAGTALDTEVGAANGVNKIGVVVGHVGTDAVAWHNGKKIVLAMPSSVTFASAAGINDSGEIVGEAIRNDISTAFLRLTDAKVVFLPSLPGMSGSRAYAINDSNVVAGTIFNDDGATRGCVWIDRKPAALPSLGGKNSEARNLNKNGDVVGDADLPGGKSHACLWKNGKAVDLGTLPGDDTSRALYVNDSDEVVGVSGFKTAFLWKDGQMYKLQDIMDPKPNWVPAQATVINNKGQIAGWGTNENGRVYGFLLTPK
jgi:probable HAF family extracellular repeat protein